MSTIRAFLESQPLLALFLAIGSGYALGQVSIRGFALGAGAVLFTGLLIGAIAPKATPPGMVSTGTVQRLGCRGRSNFGSLGGSG